MKVLHLAAVDYGGAGNAALRLHSSLLNKGVDSRMLVLTSRGDCQQVTSLDGGSPTFRLLRFVNKAYLRLSTRLDYYFQVQDLSLGTPPEFLLETVGFCPDVIVAHVLSNFLSFPDIRALHQVTGAAVVWHLLDMGMMTGGCHYAWKCNGYENRCDSCPALRYWMDSNIPAKILDQKQLSLRVINPSVVVAGSSHLVNQARLSSLFRDSRIEKILLGVDPEVFYPGDRLEARRSLGIPEDKKIIFFGAQSLSEPRKGMEYMIAAMKRLAEISPVPKADILLLTAGAHALAAAVTKDLGLATHHLGLLKGGAALAEAYRAADVFVCPSIEDSGPMMINEAMMCGTPVVAFYMGVAPDLIIPGETGELAILKNATDLARGIIDVIALDYEAAKSMSVNARSRALSLCDPAIQAAQFCQLFEEISDTKYSSHVAGASMSDN